MDEKPQARTEGLVFEWVGEELVVYDSASSDAHCLAPAVASIWERCDGRRSVEQIAGELALEPARVLEGLRELRDAALLERTLPVEAGISRRVAAKRLAQAGAAALSAPLIYTIAIPAAAAAQSANPCILDNGSPFECPVSTNPCFVNTCENENGVAVCVSVPKSCPAGSSCEVQNGLGICVFAP
jgi:hypothetical protein